MPRGNGGVLGPANIPTTSVAKGVWSLMEQQLAQRQGIWPGGPLGYDPYFEYTTLLLPGNGTNGAQNNTFLDGSTNNFTITRNGNTTQGTFSPFSQTGWGNYFDGAGDYLTVPDNAALELGTSNFTIELWVYPTVFIANYLIGKMTNSSTASGFLIRLADTTGVALFFASSNGSSWDIAGGIGSVALTLNAWNHIAVSRSGSSFRLWVNGSSGGTATSSSAIQNNTAVVGIGDVAGGGGPTTGYISNVRIVNGSAVYDPSSSTITVPTAPLTAITNTSLLTCQSNRFIDNSTNNFTITKNGDTRVVAFSPFNPSASWSAATYGGSGYFDGSGDYLSAASNTAFNLTGDYTVECWFYANSFPGQPALFGIGSDNAGLVITVDFSKIYGYIANVGNVFGSGGTTLITNSWNHIAIVRSGTTNTCYINGSQSGTTYSSSSTISSTGGVGIGRTVAGTSFNDWNGYVTDFRIVKGTAVYTGNFTPPTAPLTAITNTSLLLNFTNAGIYDATSKNDLETVGAAAISTAQNKWGGSSIIFNGSTAYLYGPTSRMLVLGSGDFTVEGWFYFNSVSSGVLLDWRSDGTGFDFYLSTGNLNLSTSGTYYGGTSGITLVTGQWYHIALTRSGTAWRIYVNGTSYANITNSTNFTATILRVGYGAGATYFNGYLQDLRLTPGYARYTGASYTVPTAAFPTL